MSSRRRRCATRPAVRLGDPGDLTGRTQALEDLAVELYARGLSTRGIEDAFTDESGRRLLSRAAVSEITERLWAEYEDFIAPRSSEYRIVYLYVDGIAERLHAGQPREAVIAVALGKHHLAKMIADPRFIVLDRLTHLDAEARFIAVVLSVYALVFASGGMQETSSDKSDKQNATQHGKRRGRASGLVY